MKITAEAIFVASAVDDSAVGSITLKLGAASVAPSSGGPVGGPPIKNTEATRVAPVVSEGGEGWRPFL